jgi:hypothetical protein
MEIFNGSAGGGGFEQLLEKINKVRTRRSFFINSLLIL